AGAGRARGDSRDRAAVAPWLAPWAGSPHERRRRRSPRYVRETGRSAPLAPARRDRPLRRRRAALRRAQLPDGHLLGPARRSGGGRRAGAQGVSRTVRVLRTARARARTTGALAPGDDRLLR